jgi:hypothetical protein
MLAFREDPEILRDIVFDAVGKRSGRCSLSSLSIKFKPRKGEETRGQVIPHWFSFTEMTFPIFILTGSRPSP